LDWSVFLDVAGGVAALIVGLGFFIGMFALARTLNRVNRTLDRVDEQITALGIPVSETLSHVGGIADTADQTIARLSGVVGSLEQVAGTLSKTAKLSSDALSPAIVNVGATIGGISAGLRRLVRGDKSTGENA
jgi:uncharacterized protein YoxC